MQYGNMNMAMQVDKGSLSVIGTSSIQVPTDLALLNLSITTENTSLEEASDENARISKNILISLTDFGISKDDIDNQDVFVTKNYDNTNNTVSSYTVTNTIVIKVKDFSKLREIYSLAVENGANGNMNINFILSNPSYYYNKAVKRASQDALSKASLLAKNFGFNYFKINLNFF